MSNQRPISEWVDFLTKYAEEITFEGRGYKLVSPEDADEIAGELQALRADVERYLWLIDNIDPADVGLPQPVDYWDTRDPVWKRQIDAAIDAAIRARGES